MDNIQIRTEVLSKLKNHLADQSYRDAIKNTSSFNVRLVNERRLRLPFLDAQTGVAQSDSYIWADLWQRMPGHTSGQLYSYPAKRWKKKRRQYLLNDNYLTRRNRENEITGEEVVSNNIDNNNRIDIVENYEKFIDDSKESWLRDFDDGSDLPDAGELDDPESDYDDYEEYSTRKKKKKKDAPKRKRIEYSDAEKPYSCDICGARYKTRPGLSYHYSHSHQNDGSNGSGNNNNPNSLMTGPNNSGRVGIDEEDMPYTPPRQLHHPSHQSQPTPVSIPPQNMPPNQLSMSMMSSQHMTQHLPQQHSTGMSTPAHKSSNPEEIEGQRSASGKPLASPSAYCDFCLGDSAENKKTRSAEELVSCSDCGRSAHPTCLQFTPNMVISVKKYRWQCIECKSCGLCGTSDNDDQLLFCDDCDRGYHMYCLKPPLSEPPEGSWSCHLCIEEYHTPRK